MQALFYGGYNRLTRVISLIKVRIVIRYVRLYVAIDFTGTSTNSFRDMNLSKRNDIWDTKIRFSKMIKIHT